MKYYLPLAVLLSAVLAAPIITQGNFLGEAAPVMSEKGEIVPFDSEIAPELSDRDVDDEQPAMSKGGEVIPLEAKIAPEISRREVDEEQQSIIKI